MPELRRIPKEVEHLVLQAATSQNAPIMVFGSTARGDGTESSDIDVLQLSDTPARPMAKGQINLFRYTSDHLMEMANRGALFILHLAKEGVILRDPEDKLEKCLAQYRPPDNYDAHRRLLRIMANLLDVSEKEYNLRWKAYNELAIFVLRTALYVRFAELDSPLFSISQIATRLGREDLNIIGEIKRSKDPSFVGLSKISALISEFLETAIHNSYGSTEALITNEGLNNPALVVFGLRVLGRENTNHSYDLLSFLPFG